MPAPSKALKELCLQVETVLTSVHFYQGHARGHARLLYGLGIVRQATIGSVFDRCV